jgi:uncharacterized protein YuzE
MDHRMKTKRPGQLHYYPKSDVLHYLTREGEQFGSREVAPGVTLELDERGKVIGIEILDASRFMHALVLKQLRSAPAKSLRALSRT